MKKLFVAGVLLIAALGGAALWIIGREPAPATGETVAPVPPDEPPPPDQPPPATQDDLDRLAEVEAMRGLYHSLRGAFASSAPLARSRQRLAVPLGRLWPGPSPSWKLDCRGRVCRVQADGPAESWRTALRADPGVLALVDRFAHDPDGTDPAAYLMLSQEDALSGAEILAGVERRLRDSAAARTCLAQAPESGTVEYELEVDDSGITYRLGGTLGIRARACVDDVLAEIITSTDVAPPVKAAALRVSLRTLR
jgi:hypothetical protein